VGQAQVGGIRSGIGGTTDSGYDRRTKWTMMMKAEQKKVIKRLAERRAAAEMRACEWEPTLLSGRSLIRGMHRY
jgi:hypothetical protein